MDTTLERVAQTQAVELAEDRRLVLPSEVAEVLGEFSPDDVLLFKTEQGVLVTTREMLLGWALDGIGAVIRDSGETLEELIESGREIREELIAERYAARSSG